MEARTVNSLAGSFHKQHQAPLPDSLPNQGQPGQDRSFTLSHQPGTSTKSDHGKCWGSCGQMNSLTPGRRGAVMATLQADWTGSSHKNPHTLQGTSATLSHLPQRTPRPYVQGDIEGCSLKHCLSGQKDKPLVTVE